MWLSRLSTRLRAAVARRRTRSASWAGCGAVFGLCAAMLGVILSSAVSWQLGVAVAPLAAGVGATLGAIGGLVGGSMASAVGGDEWDVHEFVRNAGITWGASAGIAATVMSALINPLLGPALAVLAGPCFIYLDKMRHAWMEIFTRRTILVSTALERLAIGSIIGFSLGLFIVTLVSLFLVPTAPLKLIVVVLFVGACAGASVAIGSSICGASRRRAALFAIEASVASTVAASLGAALALLVAPLPGIILATCVSTIWGVKRGMRIYPHRCHHTT